MNDSSMNDMLYSANNEWLQYECYVVFPWQRMTPVWMVRCIQLTMNDSSVNDMLYSPDSELLQYEWYVVFS